MANQIGRPKTKTSKPVNINMNAEIADRLTLYTQETGLSKTVAIERILKEYFEKIDQSKK